MIQKWFLSLLILVFLGSGFILASCATDNGTTDDATALTEIHSESESTYLGSEVCLECHENRLHDLPKNKHWQKSDLRTPAASEHGCETCHGPGSHHMEVAGESKASGEGSKTPGSILFAKNSNDSSRKQNAICLNCHQADVKHWQGSLHDTDDMSCVSCHSMHKEDRAMSKVQEQTFCYSCHQDIRSETNRPYRHPIREELISCSDCHNPHGSAGPALLNQLTLNDNCYTCHAEKRGPYLWEHEPVSEDCSTCHKTHGSLHPALLTSRPPLLCQQCHQSTRITHARQGFFFGKEPQPEKGGAGPGGGEGPINADIGLSRAQSGNTLTSLADQDQDQDQDQVRDKIQQGPGEDGIQEGGSSRFLQGGSCLNCHSLVHGSNHPSGVKLMR